MILKEVMEVAVIDVRAFGNVLYNHFRLAGASLFNVAGAHHEAQF